MNRMILAVGGTGQMVLLRYLQLFLLGVVKDPFRAIVVDTDEILPGIRTIASFLEELQFGPERTAALGAELPTVDALRPNTGVGETLTDIVTGNKRLAGGEFHPARAFFDTGTLELELMRGLFARPALSSVISHETLRGEELRPGANSTVVVVGSLIGGTGGGLIAPIIDSVYAYQVREAIQDVKMRGVFFGQYFTPQAGRLASDVLRFKSSQLFVLKTMEDKLRSLHSFYIVGGTGAMVDRDPEEEKRGMHLPWNRLPTHPFWEGVQALDFLLQESAKEKAADFRSREFDKVDDRPDLEAARLRLMHGLAITRIAIRREVILRVKRENWLETIWGGALADLVALYWKTAIQAEGADQAFKEFAKQVQQSLKDLWNGEKEDPGLAKAFPNLDGSVRVRPQHIRSVAWPRPKEAGSQNLQLFGGSGQSAKRLAATILFWILRRGELK